MVIILLYPVVIVLYSYDSFIAPAFSHLCHSSGRMPDDLFVLIELCQIQIIVVFFIFELVFCGKWSIIMLEVANLFTS